MRKPSIVRKQRFEASQACSSGEREARGGGGWETVCHQTYRAASRLDAGCNTGLPAQGWCSSSVKATRWANDSHFMVTACAQVQACDFFLGLLFARSVMHRACWSLGAGPATKAAASAGLSPPERGRKSAPRPHDNSTAAPDLGAGVRTTEATTVLSRVDWQATATTQNLLKANTSCTASGGAPGSS